MPEIDFSKPPYQPADDTTAAPAAQLAALLPGLKSGFRTTEFWLNLLVIAVALLGAVSDKLPPNVALIVAALSAYLFHGQRQGAKDAAADRMGKLIGDLINARPVLPGNDPQISPIRAEDQNSNHNTRNAGAVAQANAAGEIAPSPAIGSGPAPTMNAMPSPPPSAPAAVEPAGGQAR